MGTSEVFVYNAKYNLMKKKKKKFKKMGLVAPI